jgi:hypothetical protein
MSGQSVILIDIPDGQATDVAFLEGIGHPVMLCHGPGDHVCPIISDGNCGMANNAHGIVFMLDLDRAAHREILAKYKAVLRDDVPIRVRVSREQAISYASLLAGIQVWTHDPGIGDLDGFAAEVEAADKFLE